MPIDASIISGLKVPESDFLGTVAKANAAQTGMLNNRLLGQQVRGKEALGKLIGANTDDNGVTDYGKVSVGARDNPDASLLLPDIQKANVDRQIAMLQRQREQTGLTVEQGKMLSGAFLPFVQQFSAKDAKPPTFEDFQQAVSAAVQALGPAADENVRKRAELALQQAHNNPAMILKLAQGTVLMGNPTPETFQLLTGPMQHGGLTTSEATTPTSVMARNPDGTLSPSAITREQFVDQSKSGPVATSAPLSRSGLSAQDLAKTVEITDQATGQPKTVTLGSLLGEDVPSGGAAPTGTGGNGRYPTPAIKSGGVATGLAPGTPELMKGSAETYRADTEAMPNLRRTLTGFDEAYRAVKAAPTGRGSDVMQNMKAFADTYNIPLPKHWDDEAKNYQEANKWLSTILTTESQRLGLGTDQARALQGEAQPSTHTVKAAALEMLPILKGMKAMDLAFPALAQKEGITPQKYVEWRGQQARAVDPIAFGADLMPQAERAAYIARLKTPEQRARYAKGLRLAMDAGLFSADALK